MMRPDEPTIAAIIEALERHLAEHDPDTVLTSALLIWEGADQQGWRMNYISMPTTSSPSTSMGLIQYAKEEIRGIYNGTTGQILDDLDEPEVDPNGE